MLGMNFYVMWHSLPLSISLSVYLSLSLSLLSLSLSLLSLYDLGRQQNKKENIKS
jgi:hypothetical protein